MDNGNKPEQNNVSGKKEIKRQLADKVAAALPELKTALGEKKFQHRIKKAVKLMTEGMGKKKTAKAAKKANAIKTTAVKKAAKKLKSAKSAN